MKETRTAQQLVDAHADAILRLSYSYLKNTQDAQDICQTVLVKLLTQAPTFASPAHERAWVLRVTANACKDLLKSPWHTRICTLEHCAQMAAPPPPDSDVIRAVNDLPAKYRVVIHLHYYEGYSTQEIGRILGLSTGAVCTRLTRARQQLKWELEEHEHETI